MSDENIKKSVRVQGYVSFEDLAYFKQVLAKEIGRTGNVVSAGELIMKAIRDYADKNGIKE